MTMDVIITLAYTEEHAGKVWPETKVWRFEIEDEGPLEEFLEHFSAHTIAGGAMINKSLAEGKLHDPKPITTADGKIVHRGDRVFNYYDQWWGYIVSEPDDEGWFYVEREGPTRSETMEPDKAVLNGERIATYEAPLDSEKG